MESSSSLNCWVSRVLALCCKIKEAVEGKRAHINELQCISVKLLADFIQRCVKQWIKVCGEGEWWNLTEQVGKELLRVLDSGLQLVILCVEKDFGKDVSAVPLVTLGFQGELSEIIDDARIYVQMINRFILHSLESFILHSLEYLKDVEKLMLEVEKECNGLLFTLEKVAYQQDKNNLINSSEFPYILWSVFSSWTPFGRSPLFSLIRLLENANYYHCWPNINDSDLSRLEDLGGGSFGKVHSAEWHTIPVAVKTFTDNNHLNDELQVFRRLLHSDSSHMQHSDSSRIMQHSDSSHIVRMLGWSAKSLVLELMDKDMEKLITGLESQLPLIQSVDLMLQIAKAMKHLHNTNVVHRDLKPANILLQSRKDRSLLIKLSDFGISKDSFKTASTHTDMRGTLMYMAPEMEDVEGKYSRKVDIYSFGLICNEILTGKIRQSRKEKLTLPTDIPNKLRKLIDTCTERDDSKRPSFDDICDSLWSLKEEVLTSGNGREAIEVEVRIGLRGMRMSKGPFESMRDGLRAAPSAAVACGVFLEQLHRLVVV